jgi:hypothetical protein
VVAFGVWRIRPSTQTAAGPAPWSDADPAGERVVLDLVVTDPDQPSVQRLVQDAGARTLARSPDIEKVEVVDREGRRLGVIRRTDPLPKEPDVPAELHEPHVRRSRTPDPLAGGSAGGGPAAVPWPEASQGDIDMSVPGRTFADRFDLPPSVTDLLADRDHPAAVVGALLAAAGRPVERHGELVLSGDVAFVVTDVTDGAEEALTHAYFRVRDSGASHGIVIRLGYADPTLVRRRDLAAPNVRYIGLDGIQRMADAVALGADPISFAVGPPITR